MDAIKGCWLPSVRLGSQSYLRFSDRGSFFTADAIPEKAAE